LCPPRLEVHQLFAVTTEILELPENLPHLLKALVQVSDEVLDESGSHSIFVEVDDLIPTQSEDAPRINSAESPALPVLCSGGEKLGCARGKSTRPPYGDPLLLKDQPFFRPPANAFEMR
jgi:hypothetical protein